MTAGPDSAWAQNRVSQPTGISLILGVSQSGFLPPTSSCLMPRCLQVQGWSREISLVKMIPRPAATHSVLKLTRLLMSTSRHNSSATPMFTLQHAASR